jgi:uncharacterized protein (DUF2237 family)
MQDEEKTIGRCGGEIAKLGRSGLRPYNRWVLCCARRRAAIFAATIFAQDKYFRESSAVTSVVALIFILCDS